MKETIKNILPAPALNFCKDAYDGVRRMGDIPTAYWNSERQRSMEAMEALHNKHKGERIFIMGNGPSLKNTDLSKLKTEKTIGMNRIYLAFPEMGFETSYYLSVNDMIIEQTIPDVQKLTLPRFITMRAMKYLQPADNQYFLYSTYTGPIFQQDIRYRMWEGATVTYMALQTAFYLGFDQAILIGVDHNFATKGKPNETIVSEGNDQNHFSGAYYDKGFKWQLPDLDTSERAYRMAREAYAAAGREVIDATVGGELEIFPKVDYETLF